MNLNKSFNFLNLIHLTHKTEVVTVSISQNFGKTLIFHLGLYNRIPQTGQLMNNRNVFLTVLETGKSKIKVPERSLSGERPLPGLSGNSLLCPHIVGGQRISLETLL